MEFEPSAKPTTLSPHNLTSYAHDYHQPATSLTTTPLTPSLRNTLQKPLQLRRSAELMRMVMGNQETHWFQWEYIPTHMPLRCKGGSSVASLVHMAVNLMLSLMLYLLLYLSCDSGVTLNLGNLGRKCVRTLI